MARNQRASPSHAQSFGLSNWLQRSLSDRDCGPYVPVVEERPTRCAHRHSRQAVHLLARLAAAPPTSRPRPRLPSSLRPPHSCHLPRFDLAPPPLPSPFNRPLLRIQDSIGVAPGPQPADRLAQVQLKAPERGAAVVAPQVGAVRARPDVVHVRPRSSVPTANPPSPARAAAEGRSCRSGRRRSAGLPSSRTRSSRQPSTSSRRLASST